MKMNITSGGFNYQYEYLYSVIAIIWRNNMSEVFWVIYTAPRWPEKSVNSFTFTFCDEATDQ